MRRFLLTVAGLLGLVVLGLYVAIAPPVFAGAATTAPGISDQAAHAAQAEELLSKAEKHVSLGSWDLAIECFEQVLKLYPDNEVARFRLANCCEQKKETPEALKHYRLVA